MLCPVCTVDMQAICRLDELLLVPALPTLLISIFWAAFFGQLLPAPCDFCLCCVPKSGSHCRPPLGHAAMSVPALWG